MKKYTHRQFLKMMGLGVVFLPFISCFHTGSKTGDTENSGDSIPEGGKKEEKKETAYPPEITVTDEDVIILTRKEDAYGEFNKAFNARIHHLPKYIAVCGTEKGVQFAIRKAAAEKLKVAVKSGGHSFEGFSSNDGGMVVNLSGMKKITWLDDDEVIVEPGCLLEDIQDVFFAKKRLLPAGSCGTVGIGGLALGGGYGFFSRKFGLTCDSLRALRMVGADGNIYDTGQHPDLLWACKGGGNGNFGVVTSFKFTHYKMPPLFSTYTLKFSRLTAERFTVLLEEWFDLTASLPEKAFAAFVLNGDFLTVLITTFEEKPHIENLFTELIKRADSYRRSLRKDLPGAMKRYYGRKGPLYFKNASGGLYRGKADLKDCKKTLFEKVVASPGIVFQINTLGGNIGRESFEAASCYPHRALPYLAELQSYWNKPSQEKKLVTAFEEIQKVLKEAGVTAHYRNYPDIHFSGWQTAYYGDHYPRLQAIKRKYDPGDLFHYPQSIRL
jgi:FAD/FMN-containing dehydrogenase